MIQIYNSSKKSTKIKINKRLNEYLDIYMCFYKDLGPEEGFSSFFPRLIWIENKEKCIQTMIELDEWTCDDHLHILKPIHEFALYRLLCITEDSISEESIFDLSKKTVFDDYESVDDYILGNLDNISLYLDILFQDHDFLRVSDYLKDFTEDPYKFEKEADVYLDDYIDLMPNDIRIEYLGIKQSIYPADISTAKFERSIDNNEDLLFHTDRIMDYFSHSISSKGAYKLLWNENGIPKKENSAQQLLGFISRMYCENNNIDITLEAETGKGPVDFKYSYGNNFKTIVEIKRGSNNLKHGLEKQTVQYMLSEKVETAYFIVIVLYENELNKIQKVFDSANSIKLEYNLNIKPIIIDARSNKLSASKTREVTSKK